MNTNMNKKAIIVGAGIGGLSTAIYLQLKGYKVSVFESNSQTGGRANVIKSNGFTFDTGPSLLNYPWVFEELFSSAGKNFYDYIKLIKVDPSISFLWQDGTQLSLSSDLHTLITQFEKIEPQSTPNLLKYLNDNYNKYKLSFDHLVGKNANTYFQWINGVSPFKLLSFGITHSFYHDLNKYFRSRYICEALGSYSMYLGGSPYELPGIFTILPYGELAYGLTLPKGGIYSLVNAIEKLAREVGVEIHVNKPVSKILVDDYKILGIELSTGEKIQSPIVISNVDVLTTYNYLLPPIISQKKLKKINSTKMTPSVLTFYWGVKGKISGLPHHTIFLPNDYRNAFKQLTKIGSIPDELPFYCSVPSATDAELAQDRNSVVFILIPLPLLSQMGIVDWKLESIQLKQKVLVRMKQHGIEIDKSRIIFEKVLTPEDWKNKFGLYDGSAFGASHTLFQMGPRRLKNYDSDIQGLFFTGASTTPGTGLPMTVISGKMTAERIEEYVH